MANTTFTQATLTAIELAITTAISKPKVAIKGSIDLDNGGSLVYRSLDELINFRNNIKKVLDSEVDVDLDQAKKSAFRPITPTLSYRKGNL